MYCSRLVLSVVTASNEDVVAHVDCKNVVYLT